MSTALSIQNISKKYVLRHEYRARYTTLRETITEGAKTASQRLFSRFRGGDGKSDAPAVEEFWALKDVNLEIEHGERVGIIGRNGAGKSTLLKILSRIVEPTTGRVRITGRLASLLEVGTGFHPELTGRENILLNASILGMGRREVRRKFDEIVSFADVEKFLDTPVKRYSSGMYVRLAFAVAAHLDPDILLVDEVLAVGDAAFQRKCLGKMEQVSSEGRTVLFVSHSMPTVTSLCRRAVLLEGGRICHVGPTSEVILRYYTNDSSASPAMADFAQDGRTVGDRHARLLAGRVRNSRGEPSIEIGITEPLTVEMHYEVLRDDGLVFEPNFHFWSADGVCAFVSADTSGRCTAPGTYVARCIAPGNLFNEGTYFVGLALTSFEKGVLIHFFERNALSFNVIDPMEHVPTRSDWAGAIPGVVRPLLEWKTERLA